jgi:hypothetical protein
MGIGQAIVKPFEFLCLQSRAPLVLAMKKAVDYLLIAKPVAINHSGIRRDCAVS